MTEFSFSKEIEQALESKKSRTMLDFCLAQSGSRTHTHVSELRPERSASANSAIWANHACILTKISSKSSLRT